MVVEDNDDLLSYLSRKLSATYRVITSPSAEQAVILLEQNDIDIVLTDIALGGMSGIELCRKIELGVMVRLAIGRNVFCDGFAQSGFVGLQFGTSW